MSKFRALARLFRRTDNEVISQIYTHTINQPMCVEPGLGEHLIGAYMSGAVVYNSDRAPRQETRVGILEISGALVSRPMPGPSGSGPMSYEEIRDQFDMLMDDPSVDAVVLRMDSPGGLAAGLFDLTDHINSRKGEKPVHAVVDDMAYSAAYGIASAADQIWVSRTGGVGSVGVVSYHIDQSEYDAKQGFKVTPIYAGSRKVDFSPHFPLSDEALRQEQEVVDRLYDMFTDAVSRYRGLSADAIRATEAGVFYGEKALEVGFADKVGTLRDALAYLAAGETTRSTVEVSMSNETEMAAEMSQPEMELDKTTVTAGVAMQVVEAVLSSELPANLQVALMKAGLTEENVEERLEHAKAIAGLCKTAKMERMAEVFVASNAPVDVVRSALIDRQAEESESAAVDVTLPHLGNSKSEERFTTADVYRSRQEQARKRT
jgi:signal peptide peptidase SppA